MLLINVYYNAVAVVLFGPHCFLRKNSLCHGGMSCNSSTVTFFPSIASIVMEGREDDTTLSLQDSSSPSSSSSNS
eukprot:m.194864 g.194864  ORF g.194864 m.194864 type:complete len:75 (-) comp13662_c0_seq8:3889-4113(-)